MITCFLYSTDETLQELLRKHSMKCLLISKDESQRIVIRRRHLWEDALNRFKSGLNEKKYIKITFVGEPAVDQGGPLREFFHLLLCCISQNNNLFGGDALSLGPVHNMLQIPSKIDVGSVYSATNSILTLIALAPKTQTSLVECIPRASVMPQVTMTTGSQV